MMLGSAETGGEFEVVIERVADKEFAAIKKDKKRFPHFDWKAYEGLEVYKLRQVKNNITLGLMHIVDHTDPGTDAIEIGLLEVSADNVGKDKKFDGIAGCLIAFACRESIKREHGGIVFLLPKGELIPHYARKYHFMHIPIGGPGRPHGIMVTTLEVALGLIKTYLD